PTPGMYVSGTVQRNSTATEFPSQCAGREELRWTPTFDSSVGERIDLRISISETYDPSRGPSCYPDFWQEGGTVTLERTVTIDELLAGVVLEADGDAAFPLRMFVIAMLGST